jgi:hypothetical protein
MSVIVAAPSAFAQGPPSPCLTYSEGTLSFASSSVDWLDGVVLSWSAHIGPNCPDATLSIVEETPQLNDGPQTFELGIFSVVGSYGGSIGVLPMRSTRWALRLTEYTHSYRDIAFADIMVNQPQGPLPEGLKDVTISNDTVSERRKFAHAVQTPGATVRIAGDAELNLSGLDELPLAPNVKILGDRRVHPRGPRLYTTTFPNPLFVIPSSNAPSHERISGLRLDGVEPDDPFDNLGDEDSIGIRVEKADVEIDHNEIYRWRGAGVSVRDGDSDRNLITRDNAATVLIEDNYIHHNQHPTGHIGGGHGGGYGVETIHGAFAVVTHNVFTSNRHAISGDGRPGTGYFFVGNLITDGGGVNGHGFYTHQIDMHGCNIKKNDCTGGCLIDFECGLGGEYEDAEFNTVWYSDGPAVKLRGTPSVRMDVRHNAFVPRVGFGPAVVETEHGLVEADNNYYAEYNGRRGPKCDFDGDGIPDDFVTTSVAWYYRSSLLDGRYVFLTNSNTSAEDVLVGDISNDGRCDAVAGPFVVITPSGAPFDILPPGDQVAVVNHPVSLQLGAWLPAGRLFWAAANLPDGLRLDEQTGHISGTPLKAATYTVMFGADNGQGDTVTRVFHWTVNPDLRPVPNIVGATRAQAASLLNPAGMLLGSERDVAQTDCAQIGRVLDQAPAAFSEAPVGSTVAFSFGVKPSGTLHCN